MTVQVKIPTILRPYTGGEKSVPGDGANLAALLDDLETRHTGLKGRLITDDGALHRFVNVYVNDEDVRFTGSLDTALSDGDAVTILPAVAGGSPELGIAGGSPDFGMAGGSPESGIAGGSPDFGISGGSPESAIAGG